MIRFLRRDASKTPSGGGDPAASPGPAGSEPVAPTDPVRVVALADEMFARGATLEAIALLTEANRRRRDHRLEQRLVTMRFDAFRDADWSEVHPTVPEAVPDLFPGATIPEIAGADLDIERVRSALLNHGSLIVRGLVGPERVAQLTADIDRALDGYDAWFAGKGLATAAPWFVPFAQEPKKVERKFRRDVGGVLAVDSPPSLFDLIETFDAAGVSAASSASSSTSSPRCSRRSGRCAASRTTRASPAGTRTARSWAATSVR